MTEALQTAAPALSQELRQVLHIESQRGSAAALLDDLNVEALMRMEDASYVTARIHERAIQ